MVFCLVWCGGVGVGGCCLVGFCGFALWVWVVGVMLVCFLGVVVVVWGWLCGFGLVGFVVLFSLVFFGGGGVRGLVGVWVYAGFFLGVVVGGWFWAGVFWGCFCWWFGVVSLGCVV